MEYANYLEMIMVIFNSQAKVKSFRALLWMSFALLLTLFSSRALATPVSTMGQLSVSGSQMLDQHGNVAVLRGMSLFWSQANVGSPFYNADVVNWLAEDWHANVIRAAMGIEGDWSENEKAYLSDPTTNKNRVKAVVDAAIAKGIYVIIDWHDHAAENHQSQAISFFTEMAQTYGDHPNIIYEIYNEPLDIPWSTIKNYALPVIDAIRQHDPDNIIVVGTPKWSSDVEAAAASPITGETNIMYTFHFYASEEWHYNNYMTAANNAINAGLPLFVTEWGNSGASGDGSLNTSYMDAFMNWIQQKQLSWANWSISNKSESSAALQSWASANGGWSASDLTQSGTYTRAKMIEYNDPWEPVSTLEAVPSAFSAVGMMVVGGRLKIQGMDDLQMSGSVLEIRDLNGQLIRSLALTGGSNTDEFNLSELNSGVYVAVLRSGSGSFASFSQKIILP